MTAKRISSVVAASTTTAVLAVPASAAAPTVTLNLKDGSTKHELIACGIRHHYAFFHVGRPVAMDGSVQPTPSRGWRVKVKVKKCVRGQFRTVWQHHAKGRNNGTFTIAYTPHHAGAYFTRAYYYGVKPRVRSSKQYFHA